MKKIKQIPIEYFDNMILIHNPVRVSGEHIKIAENEKHNAEPLIDIKEQYPTVKSLPTGGIVLPSITMPNPFGSRLINTCLDMDGVYGSKTSMIDEMITNAADHGNKFSKEKSVYLLWHDCPFGKEAYVVDQGEKHFNPEECFGKYDDLAGLDLLSSRSEEFQYFSIMDTRGMKRGTLLRILLERPYGNVCSSIRCNYTGHNFIV